MAGTVTVTIQPRPDARLLLAGGMSTPHALCTGVTVAGAKPFSEPERETSGWAPLVEDHTGQPCYTVVSGDTPITVTYRFEPGAADYPAQMFTPHPSRFTRAAQALVQDAQALADADDPALAMAQHVAALFSYGHPDTRFYETHDEIPQICGLTEGSCVDINLYFIASLRAIGVKTGYAVGPFFPAEKCAADGSGWCEDMHCWVVTEDTQGIREWDIAHHLKLGTRQIAPGLNPKPGKRFALGHSMGLSFAGLGLNDVKLVSEPMWIAEDGRLEPAELDIRCAG